MAGNVKSVELPPTVGQTPAEGTISDDQHALLKEGVALIVPVPWPANPTKRVGLHAIGRQDQIFARAQARLSARDFCNCQKPEEAPIPDVEDMCFRDEIVQRAFVKLPVPAGEEPEPLFPSVEEMRLKLTVAEVEALYEMHARHEAWVAPLMRAEMTGNQALFTTILAELKKKPLEESTDFLMRLPHATLAACLLFTVSSAPDK